MVVLAAIAFAMWAVLPSSAGQIPASVDHVPAADHTSAVPRPGPDDPQPASAPSAGSVRPPKPTTTYDQGPKDCASCANPGVG
jgi:hypothetical protein